MNLFTRRYARPHPLTDSLKWLLVTSFLTLSPFFLAHAMASDSILQADIPADVCQPIHNGQTLVIPCVKVDKGTESFYYGVTLQDSPDNDSQLILTALTEIDGVSIATSNCLSSYSVATGQLVIPCASRTAQVLYALDDFAAPTLFSTHAASEPSPRATTASPPRTPPFTENGSWNPSGGQDAYSVNNPAYPFTVKTAGEFIIDLTSTVDNYLFLLDSNNKVLASNDDTVGNNAQIKTTLPPGSYIVVAATYAKAQKGTFILTAKPNPVPDPILVPSFTVTGSWISSCGTDPYCPTHKRYKFTTVADKTVIDLSSTPDNYLFLYDSNGKIIAYNDDTIGKNARIKIALPPNNIYTIVATTNHKGERGNFTLSGNNIWKIPRIPYSMLSSWRSSAGMDGGKSFDNPHYEFTTSGGPIAIDLYRTSMNGAGSSVYLYLLDTNDNIVRTSIRPYSGSTGGSANNHASIYTSLPPGTYTIVAAGSLGETGDFVLSVGTSVVLNPRSLPFTERGSWSPWDSSANPLRYSFSVSGSGVRQTSLSLTPFTSYYPGNLNIQLRLLDSAGNLIANSGSNGNPRIDRALPSGNYTVEIGFSYNQSQTVYFTLSGN